MIKNIFFAVAIYKMRPDMDGIENSILRLKTDNQRYQSELPKLLKCAELIDYFSDPKNIPSKHLKSKDELVSVPDIPDILSMKNNKDPFFNSPLGAAKYFLNWLEATRDQFKESTETYEHFQCICELASESVRALEHMHPETNTYLGRINPFRNCIP